MKLLLDLRPTQSATGLWQTIAMAASRWVVAASLVAVLGASATLAAVRLVARELPGLVVSGSVVGPEGRPVEGADVVVLVSRWARPVAREGPMQATVLGRARSDAQGIFRIEVADDEGTPDDRRLLVAAAQGSGFVARKRDDLADPVGEPLRLLPEQPVDVRLVDLEGSPIAGAEVRLLGAYPYRPLAARIWGMIRGPRTPCPRWESGGLPTPTAASRYEASALVIRSTFRSARRGSEISGCSSRPKPRSSAPRLRSHAPTLSS